MRFRNTKQVDFLFLAEVTSREEKSLILLTEELKRRGYSAEYLLSGEWEGRRYKKQPKVLVINSCFDMNSIEHTVYTIAGEMKKVVTLRWEQIETKEDRENGEGCEEKRIVETSKTFNTFAWGDDYYNRMIKIGMDEKYIHCVGPVFMDFLRPELKQVYYSQPTLKEKYHIPFNKKILLFISNFSVIDFQSENYIWNETHYGTEAANNILSVERKTQNAILEWFVQFLKDYGEEWVLIYRPHPGVQEGTKAVEISNKTEGFFFISDLSAQQWIVAADKIVTNVSTMISECYVSRKPVIVIRPYQLPDVMDTALYEGVEYLETYDRFVNAVLDDEYSINIPIFNKFYDITDIPSYIRISDELEEIYKCSTYDAIWNEDELVYVRKRAINQRIKNFGSNVLKDMKLEIKKVMRCLHKVYEPKTVWGKKYMIKAENIIKHDQEFKRKVRYILNMTNE